MKKINKKEFSNGVVYALETDDGHPIEVTDTFLPYYTKDAIGKKQNGLQSENIGSRAERWMIGVSCMSGCPVHCKFCATGKLKKFRNLTSAEIIEQINFVLSKHSGIEFSDAKEHKINYTRMGEPFLNINELKKVIESISNRFPKTHHYISTVGLKGSDFSFIEDNITLQFSIHSFDESKRDWLIPINNKMTLEEIGKIRTKSKLKTTINLTLVEESDFDINKLAKYFDPKYFFIKLSPINKNDCSELNGLGNGIIQSLNLI